MVMKKLSLLFIISFIVLHAFGQPTGTAIKAFDSRPFPPVPSKADKGADPFLKTNAIQTNTDKPRPYALVAGGSKGIGYAIAEALARCGYNLILIARHLDSLATAKRKLESA